MIDVSKCVYEDSYDNPEYDEVTHYFVYPKDLGETEFYSEEDYGNVVSMCISLTINPDGTMLCMSPTVDEGDYLMDVDWRDLYEGINYTDSMIDQLVRMARVGDNGDRK